MTIEKWKKIIAYKKELKGIPIIANADFGHTTPIFTFPIGGKAILKAKDNKIELRRYCKKLHEKIMKKNIEN